MLPTTVALSACVYYMVFKTLMMFFLYCINGISFLRSNFVFSPATKSRSLCIYILGFVFNCLSFVSFMINCREATLRIANIYL